MEEAGKVFRRSGAATEEMQLATVTRRGRNRRIAAAQAFDESPHVMTERNLEVATVENESHNIRRERIGELTLATMDTAAFFASRAEANTGTEARVEMYEPFPSRGRTKGKTVATIKNYVKRPKGNRVLTVATLENENPGTKSNITPALIGPNPPVRRTNNGDVTLTSLGPWSRHM